MRPPGRPPHDDAVHRGSAATTGFLVRPTRPAHRAHRVQGLLVGLLAAAARRRGHGRLPARAAVDAVAVGPARAARRRPTCAPTSPPATGSPRPRSFGPDVVLHLAAQPLVSVGYERPAETFETNVLGTARVLESLAALDRVEATLVITTDKVYDPAQRRPHDESAPPRRPRAVLRQQGRRRDRRGGLAGHGGAARRPRGPATSSAAATGPATGCCPTSSAPGRRATRRPLRRPGGRTAVAARPRAAARLPASTSRRSPPGGRAPDRAELRPGRAAVRQRRRAGAVRGRGVAAARRRACRSPAWTASADPAVRGDRRAHPATRGLAAEPLGWVSVLDWQTAVTHDARVVRTASAPVQSPAELVDRPARRPTPRSSKDAP